MKILVTGGTGFIGSRLVEALLAGGQHEVYLAGRRKPTQSQIQGAGFMVGDLSDASFAQNATENIEAVVHCAGLAGTWGPYSDFHRANVELTEVLLKACRHNGVRRFVNLSSPSIYFDFKDQFDLKENDLPKKFSNAYAQTKYEAELLVQAYNSTELTTFSLRPRSVIGRGDQNVLPRLLRLQESGNLIQIGNGESVVDITTVANLLDAIGLCLTAPPSAMGQVYNISNGAPVKFWDFVDEVLRSAGRQRDRRHFPYWLVMTTAILNEKRCRLLRKKQEPALLPISVAILTFSMTMNISKARENLGYSPTYSTSDGIREFLASLSI